MSMLKKLLINILCINISLSFFQISLYASESDDEEEKTTNTEYIDYGILAINNIYTVENLLLQSRFSQPGGHGFAAEEANNLLDNVLGNNSKVIGYDNVINGPDRVLTRSGTPIYIQDKYWSTPEKTVRSAFDGTRDGIYKYINEDGTPMQLEVPSDQYSEVVKIFQEKIIGGKVPGVTNPEEASTIVRKGHITYQQAVNLSKAGNIDSLLYDSTNGFVCAKNAFGISTTLDFAIRTLNGEPWKTALKNSAMVGLKTGVNSFAIYVITSQLSRTNIFKPSSDALVNALGDDYVKALLKLYGESRVTNSASRSAAEKILQNQALTITVTVFVITLPDAVDLIRGRISTKQLIKNLAITTAGVTGSFLGNLAGSTIGNSIAPSIGGPVGGVVGSVVGGTVAGYGAEAILDLIIEDDIDEMIEIIQNIFYEEAINYLLTESEAETVAQKVSNALCNSTLKDMYESNNKEEFAKALLVPLFEDTVSNRSIVEMPSSEEMRYELLHQLDGIVFIH